MKKSYTDFFFMQDANQLILQNLIKAMLILLRLQSNYEVKIMSRKTN